MAQMEENETKTLMFLRYIFISRMIFFTFFVAFLDDNDRKTKRKTEKIENFVKCFFQK